MRATAVSGALIAALALSVACGGTSSETAAAEGHKSDPAAVAHREAALASARVWTPPAVPIPDVNLRDNPTGDGGFPSDADVACKFTVQEVSGTTPKFHCELPGGEVVKVKYGTGNPELPAEVAATRLLSALGFGADRMYVVKRVKCAGCPTYPFYALRCLKEVGMKSACLPGGINYDSVVTFESAVIERRLEGKKIEAPPTHAGWAFYELEKIDEARGGSPIAEVDALRLMAMFLAHWDNKGENQRLLCPAGQERPDGTCGRPLAILQDVGATFGPVKLELHNWRKTPIWSDPKTCTVSMKTLPWNGATFPDRRISEAGRQFLIGLLEQLSDRQLRDLFEGARITSFDQISGEGRSADAWIRTFRDKLDEIRSVSACE